MPKNNKNTLHEDLDFEKELENYLELPAEDEEIQNTKQNEKIEKNTIFNPEKAAMRRNRRNKRKFDSHVTNLEKKQSFEKRKEKGKEKIQKQKLIKAENALPANLPKFLGKKHKIAA